MGKTRSAAREVDLLVSAVDVHRLMRVLEGHGVASVKVRLTEQGKMMHGRPEQVRLDVPAYEMSGVARAARLIRTAGRKVQQRGHLVAA